MFLILVYHAYIPYLGSGKVGVESSHSFLLHIFIDHTEFFGAFGNSSFFIIAGYFAYKGSFSYKQIIRVISPVVFWSCFFFIYALIFRSPQIEETFTSPMTTVRYFLIGNAFFVPGYCFVKIITKNLIPRFVGLSIKRQIYAIIFCAIMCFIIQAICLDYYGSNYVFYSLFPFIQYGIGFIWIFASGIFINKHQKIFQKIPKKYYFLTVITVLGFCISSFNNNDNVILHRLTITILVPIIALVIFIFFLKLPAFVNEKINRYSLLVLGVYIIHVNQLNPLKRLFLDTGTDATNMIASNSIFLSCLPWIIALVLGITSGALEFARQKIFQSIKNNYMHFKFQR
jgi:hypothetical protein